MWLNSGSHNWYFKCLPKNRREEIIQLRKELLDVYTGVYNLKTVEKNLEAELGMPKKTSRKGLIISDRLQKSKIEKRIAQLNSSI